jgi:hypothetical protein
LAEAAQVSLISASRLVRQLRNDGFLDDSEDSLRLEALSRVVPDSNSRMIYEFAMVRLRAG